MKWVKAVVETPERHLKYLLHTHLTGKEPGRPYVRMHASSVTKDNPEFCPREHVLGGLLKVKPKDEYLSTSHQVTYEIGRMLQDRVVNWFAEMGRAVGDWKCLACGGVSRFQKRPVQCGKCGCRAFKPEEVRFESAVCGASCGIDMLADLEEDLLKVVEIKTIKPEDFKTLMAPLAEHKLRTNLYLRLIDESPSPLRKRINVQSAKILYTSKGGFGNKDESLAEWGLKDGFSPFKEFTVTRDDAQTEPFVARARMVHEHRAGKAGMPAGVCPTALCKRAKACPVALPCFSGKYPAEVFG